MLLVLCKLPKGFSSNICLVSSGGVEKNSQVSLLFPGYMGEERIKIIVIKHLKFL